MKTCTLCAKRLRASNFYAYKRAPDGLASYCKPCWKARFSKKQNAARLDSSYRARRRKWAKGNRKTPAYRLRSIRQQQRYIAKYPRQHKASQLLRAAVKTGKIIRPLNCEKCGKRTKIHGHHPDYSKPLKVKWLCALCHTWEHKMKEIRK
jgi:hypothetical protein